MQRIVFGTSGNEQLTLNSQGSLFGFAGDDTLVANWSTSDYYMAFIEKRGILHPSHRIGLR